MHNHPQAPVTAKENLRQIQIICGALMAGMSVFSLVSIGVNFMNGKLLEKEIVTQVLLGVVGLSALSCYFTARLIYRKRVQELQQQAFPDLNAKLNHYRTVLLLYFALCEGAGLFGVVSYFLTGHFIFLGITGLMLLAMFVKLPLKTRLIQELQLDWQEQQELE